MNPLHPKSVKLAAERYDPDDGLVTHSPPLIARVVNLRPSPSPDHLSSEDSSEPEQNNPGAKPKKRPKKAQASRGDAVLIGFMGGQNFPELANRAGDEVLPQSDSEVSSEVMEIDAVSATSDKSADAVSLAESALLQSNNTSGKTESKQEFSSKTVTGRPELPRLLTDDTPPLSKISEHPSKADPLERDQDEAELIPSERRPSYAIKDSLSSLGIDDEELSSKSPPTCEPVNDKDSRPTAISPELRRYTVPSIGQTPGDTLPAMQASPQIDTAKSPTLPQGLPSLHDSGLKEVLEGALPKNGFHPQSTPTSANSVLPPSMSSKTTHFPSPKGHPNTSFPNFVHGHPSPAYSSSSPRDSTNMSPPSRPNVQMPPFPPRSGSDALTPQSADGYAGSYNGGPSPVPVTETMEIDRAGRVLPPLVPHPGPPIMNGSFKCNYEGCTAPPFQTQYLLK